MCRPCAIWSAAAVIVAVFFAAPPVRRPLYLGWLYAAYPIGWVVSHLMLGVIYYGVFTPLGLVMRLTGWDPMNRRMEPEATSYWVEHRPSDDPARYFRQF